MPPIPQDRLDQLVEAVRTAEGSNAKGRALEDLICELFSYVPGVEVVERDVLNALRTEELDIALFNSRDEAGLHFLPYIILVECKNWTGVVGAADIGTFIRKCQGRGCDHGILIAANGISGVAAERTAAHGEVARGLAEGTRIVVFTLEEIEQIASTDQLVKVIKRKLCQLVAAGTVVAYE